MVRFTALVVGALENMQSLGSFDFAAILELKSCQVSLISLHRPDNRRSPVQARHEIYVGNYPVKFREADLRKLFEESGVSVGAIRMKMDGRKV